MHARSRVVASLVLGALLALTAQARPVSTKKGLVVSAHGLASRAGAQVLARGGNAVDALVATAFVLSVAEPHSSGLGGGGFALLYEAKTGEIHALDFRETAPAAASPDMFVHDGQYDPLLSRFGGKAVATPGAVAGYTWLAEHFGTQPLAQLVEPAAVIAERGVRLGPGDQKALKFGAEVLSHSPEAAAFYGLNRPVLGSRRKDPALARLLRQIGTGGAHAFYSGPAAEALLKAVASSGGVLTAQDLEHYEVRPLKPLEGSYRGHRIVTLPPPSAGGFAVLATLEAMEQLHLPEGPRHANDPARPHDLVELWNRAYAARARYLGDPRADPAVSKHVEELLAPASLARWAQSVGPRATPPADVDAIASLKEGDDTTHISVVDAAGNVALMTTTVNGAFGSGVFVPELGIVLNNEMDDFAAASGGNLYGLVGGKYNVVAPGKTPVSTMAPMIVFDGDRPWIALGSPGGSKIATALTQIILHVIDDHMDIQQAVAAPRIHSQYLPDKVEFEPGRVNLAMVQALRKQGHEVVGSHHSFGNPQAITISARGVRQGGSDPRGMGRAVAEDGVSVGVGAVIR